LFYYKKRMGTDSRREQILQAALACFLENGVAATSIAEIRQRSGASTGSIYHFFQSKEAIAVALYLQGLSGWTAATLNVSPDAGAGEAIDRIICDAVDWGLANSPLMQFMDENRFLLVRVAGLDEATSILLAARERGERIVKLMAEGGELRVRDWELCQPILLGPIQAWLQLHRQGQAAAEPAQAKSALACAARRALLLEASG
jgi:AcrR family transcriptional regulator